MKILVVAATEFEVGMFAATGRCEVLITGVGQIATTYALTKKLAAERFDLVIQAGVGGSFDTSVALGTVVQVTSDRYGDLGAEDHDAYIDLFDMGLTGSDEPPHTDCWLVAPTHNVPPTRLPEVIAITVNTVSGNERTIARRRAYGAVVESMEGAAFHYVCLMEQVPFIQVRSISNYVTPRDKSQWKMKDAIISLNNWLIGFTADL
jgi:futalosine hydrolase